MHNAAPKEPTDLFHHLPHHRILICKQCRFAVLPSAVARHLKELHHMHHPDRQQFVDYALGLNLADQHNITLPEPRQRPLPILPIIPGLACVIAGCGHLCATDKRMKMHWRTEHSNTKAHQPQGYRVSMQTFFRGNQLRYFIVSPLPAASSLDSGADRTGTSGAEKPDKALGGDSHVTTTEDLRLIQHFYKFTCIDSGFDIVEEIAWSTIIPEIEAKTPFLRHGIIASAALHLAFLQPCQKQQYHLIAANHQSLALPEFRTAIKSPNEDNYVALLIFTHLLIIHCFARYENEEDLLLVRGQDELVSAPDWLQIIRGTCYAFQPVAKYITGLPGVILPMEIPMNEPPLEKSTYDARLHGLFDLVQSSATRNIKGFTDVSYELVENLYRLSCALVVAEAVQSQNRYSLWVALYLWPVRVSHGYLSLLKQRHPIALILLAHYCVLLQPLDAHWYMRGYTKKLMCHIQGQLCQEWRPWLQWPLEAIGMTSNDVFDNCNAA